MTESEYVDFIKEETDLDREADLYSLEHYGIPGMHWGIRRTPTQLGHKGPGKKKSLITKAKDFQKKRKRKAAAKKRKAEAAAKKKAEAEKIKKEKESENIREKVLKSSDPKFIKQYMDLLDTKELKDRIDRITQEQKIAELANPKKKDTIKTAEDFLRSTASMAESVTKIYNAYNVVSGKGKQKQQQQNKSQQDKPNQSKSKPTTDKPGESQQNDDSKSRGKVKKTNILDSKLNEMEGQRNVSKAVNDIMNDPAVKDFMNMSAATKEDWGNINKKYKARGIRGQKWIHNS